MKALIVLAVVLTVVFATNPGLKARVGPKLIETAKDAGVQLLVRDLKNVAIPDVHSSTHIAVLGGIDYALTSIALDGFSIKKDSLTFVDEHTIAVSMSEVSAFTRFSWSYKQRSWPHSSDAGTGTVKVGGARVSAILKLGLQGDGHPSVTLHQTTVEFDTFSLSLQGGESWLYSIFTTLFKGNLKSAIQSTLENKIERIFASSIHNLLVKAPLEEDVAGGLKFDLRLTSAPHHVGKYFTTEHRGVFEPIPVGSVPVVAPFTSAGNHEGVQFFLSEGLFNSAFTAAHLKGIFTDKVTELPPSAPVSLNTDSFDEVVPPMHAKYPGTPMHVEVATVAAPTVHISSDGMALVADVDVRVSVVPDGGQEVYCFTAGAAINVSGAAQLTFNGKTHSARVVGKVGAMEAKISLKDSAVGDFPADGLQQYVDFIIQYVARAQVEDALAKGAALPSLRGASLRNTRTAYSPGQVVVAADVDYSVADLIALIDSV